jgi:hypothetical protein
LTGNLGLDSENNLVASGISGLALSLIPSTGVFSGSVNAGFGKPSPFYGILLQGIDGGEGLFQTPTITGDIQITSP